MFKAFDEFAQWCYPNLTDMRAIGPTYLPYTRAWSANLALEEIPRIRCSLLDMVASGAGSLTDKDEHGHTLLHV